MMYTIVSIVMFGGLGIIWSTDSWLNMSIKIGFFGLAVWGLIATDVVSLNI